MGGIIKDAGMTIEEFKELLQDQRRHIAVAWVFAQRFHQQQASRLVQARLDWSRHGSSRAGWRGLQPDLVGYRKGGLAGTPAGSRGHGMIGAKLTVRDVSSSPFTRVPLRAMDFCRVVNSLARVCVRLIALSTRPNSALEPESSFRVRRFVAQGAGSSPRISSEDDQPGDAPLTGTG